MIKISKIHRMILPAFCALSLLLNGCTTATMTRGSYGSVFEEIQEEEEPKEDIYTSSASAVIGSIDEQERVMALHLIERNENRALLYDGATVVEDQYGSAMSVAQLREGDIVEIAYSSEREKLGRVTLSGDAWRYEGVEKYNLNAGDGKITIGEESYSLSNRLMAFSGGKPIEVAQIIRNDVLSFQGKGRNVMSITVDKGHGYLELENEEAVLGGWIEIGQTLISQIAPDMLFTIPEGSYRVRFTAEGVEEIREITIERDRETKLDLGDIELPKPENGTVIFEIAPKTADVYVDNEKVDTTYPLKLSLGLHQVMAKASGYESLAQYIKVEPEDVPITVKMELKEQEEEEEEESDSEEKDTEEEEEEEKTEAKITISAPRDVEVYQDNLYMGITPVTYIKTPGTHTITLRKSGYVTRSYEIVVSDDNEDVTYSFADLDIDESSYSPRMTPYATPSVSPSVSPSATPTRTPEPTGTPSPTATATPTPGSLPVESASPVPSGTPGTSISPTPSGSPGASENPTPSGLPGASESPVPSGTPGTSISPLPEPTQTPGPAQTPEPTQTPVPKQTPEPTQTPEPAQTPEPTQTPEPETPEPTQAPDEDKDDSDESGGDTDSPGTPGDGDENTTPPESGSDSEGDTGTKPDEKPSEGENTGTDGTQGEEA